MNSYILGDILLESEISSGSSHLSFQSYKF